MVKNIKEGHSYKVIFDISGFFKSGDIIVALQSDDVPYCCLKNNYHGPISKNNYSVDEYNPMTCEELEEIK